MDRFRKVIKNMMIPTKKNHLATESPPPWDSSPIWNDIRKAKSQSQATSHESRVSSRGSARGRIVNGQLQRARLYLCEDDEDDGNEADDEMDKLQLIPRKNSKFTCHQTADDPAKSCHQTADGSDDGNRTATDGSIASGSDADSGINVDCVNVNLNNLSGASGECFLLDDPLMRKLIPLSSSTDADITGECDLTGDSNYGHSDFETSADVTRGSNETLTSHNEDILSQDPDNEQECLLPQQNNKQHGACNSSTPIALGKSDKKDMIRKTSDICAPAAEKKETSKDKNEICKAFLRLKRPWSYAGKDEHSFRSASLSGEQSKATEDANNSAKLYAHNESKTGSNKHSKNRSSDWLHSIVSRQRSVETTSSAESTLSVRVDSPRTAHVRRTNSIMSRGDMQRMRNMMFYAVQYNDHALLESTLQRLPRGSVNILNEDGISVLHFAAMAGATRCVRTLKNHGANLNLLDARGQTALHYAMLMNKGDFVGKLSQYGARRDSKVTVKDIRHVRKK